MISSPVLFLRLFLQQDDSGSLFGLICANLFVLAIGIFLLIAMWKMFVKAGKPGWAVIIPIYNTYVLLEIVGRPTWWLLMFYIPFVNAVFGIIVGIDLAKSFGKDSGFGIGLIFLAPIFIPILGFGDAQYVGPSAGSF